MCTGKQEKNTEEEPPPPPYSSVWEYSLCVCVCELRNNGDLQEVDFSNYEVLLTQLVCFLDIYI